MPMPAFDRLPTDKQDAIIDSAIAEFSANPYDKVSIFLIAKRAGMSRSGFYYYFSGKEDVYRCLLLRLLREFVETLPPAIDLFRLPERMLRHFAAFKGSSREAFILRILDNMKPSIQLFFSEPFLPDQEASTKLLGLDRLRRRDRESMQLLSFLILICTSVSLRRYYESDMTLDQCCVLLEESLELIRHGACKK